MVRCENCDGIGVIILSSTCLKCDGTAEIIIYENDGTENIVVCPNCEDGFVYTEQNCRLCKGTGEVY
ncbi:MAG: hypothetical protein NVS4B7_15530 [Ktedonobacteraceae bacterium]